ncbi:MAG: presqualene diphosphate synthase HpnD [Pseudomonadota bacterium]
MTQATNSLGEADSWAHVERLVQGSKSSFYWAMRLLPVAKRRAMFAVYAYCRELDDIADEPAPETEKQQGLAAWRREVNAVYDNAPTTSLGRTLNDVRQDFPIQRDDLLAVIDGVATDANGPVVRPSLAELELYCDRVAGAVGLLSVAIFGATGHAGEMLARSLGRALQFTNILRDLREDAADGRVYLPDEWLRDAGIEALSPETIMNDPALGDVCRTMAAAADGYFKQADDALAACDRRAVRPAVVMMVSYRRLLRKMERRGWPQTGDKARLSAAEKLAIGVYHGLL